MESVPILSSENPHNFNTESPPKMFIVLQHIGSWTLSGLNVFLGVKSIQCAYCTDNLNISKENLQFAAKAFAIASFVSALLPLTIVTISFIKMRPTPAEIKFHRTCGIITLTIGIIGVLPNIWGLTVSLLKQTC